MAPSSGHLLVSKAMRFIKFATDKTASVVRLSVPQSSQKSSSNAFGHAQPLRTSVKSQPIHPFAILKRSRAQHSRWLDSTVRHFSLTTKRFAPKYDRANFPVSRTSKIISQRGAAPFATTLRPNLTGGTLSRSAGGYSLGGVGKARHFSHTGGCQAQVINNVNAGIRAFLVGGGKARYDGVDRHTGEKRFRCISQTEDQVYQKWESPASKSMRGTTLEFRLSPTITALSPVLSSNPDVEDVNLNTPEILPTLGTDLARAVRDLSIVSKDLNKLSAFGDLPFSILQTSKGPVLSVRFPGCDGDLVASLCDEVGVQRGLIKEDEAWSDSKEVEMALLFPFAPTTNGLALDEKALSDCPAQDYFEKQSPAVKDGPNSEQLDWRNLLLPAVHSGSERQSGTDRDDITLLSPSHNFLSFSGYESLGESDFAPDDPYHHAASPQSALRGSSEIGVSQDLQGLEDIYQFLQVCDDARR